MGFCATRLDRLVPLWERMLSHPFLAALIPKGPASHWEPMTQAIGALIRELRLFEERAEAVGVEIKGTQPSFTTQAYSQFLLATAQNASYQESYTVLYAAEKAYHDSWQMVRKGLDPDSPWWPFVEDWPGIPSTC